MDPTLCESNRQKARTACRLVRGSVYSLYFESPPSPPGVVSSLPASPLSFMPSDKLLLAVPPFYLNPYQHSRCLSGPIACIPLYLSPASLPLLAPPGENRKYHEITAVRLRNVTAGLGKYNLEEIGQEFNASATPTEMDYVLPKTGQRFIYSWVLKIQGSNLD